MGMYAIKDTTLTALGDAVRKHTIGVSEELIQKIEGIMFDNQNSSLTVVAQNKAPKYRYILDNGYVSTEVVGNSFYIQRDDGFGEKLYDEGKLTNSIFPISFETDADTICIFFYTSYSSVYTTFDLTIIPLDENGNEYKYTPLEMADIINEFSVIPDEALNITGDCQYRFAYNGSNWFINIVGDKITTNNITNANYMFSNNELTTIPFEINLNVNASIEYMFYSCHYLKEIPIVNKPTLTSHMKFTNVFNACGSMREVPAWFVDLLEQNYNLTTINSIFGPWSDLFSNCHSLRTIPDRVMKSMSNPKASGNYYTLAYSHPFQYLYSLDEINNISCDTVAFTSNQFSRFFMGLTRVKDITFETNEDGTPMVRQWKSQTLDFTNTTGWAVYTGYITNYNSGITADKEVKDDATYQALKDDPDWFTQKEDYSRYNHDSAVRTINSLPDCSAYGTNTIKFKGTAGRLTDGGAINTLTEEEIAVATAKGWSVALV